MHIRSLFDNSTTSTKVIMNALRTLSRRLPGPVHLKPPIRLFSSRISYRNALPIAKTQRLRTHNNAQNSWRRTLTHSNRPFSRGSSQKEGSSHPNPTPNLGSPEPHSLSARLRKLTREYGYTVIGVYFALSLADFPFCFLAVKLLGAERVAHAEHVVVGGAKDMIQRVFPDVFQHKAQSVADTGAADVTESAEEAEVEASELCT
jgi:hypothetical protein